MGWGGSRIKRIVLPHMQFIYIATSLISLTTVKQLLNFYYGNGFDL